MMVAVDMLLQIKVKPLIILFHMNRATNAMHAFAIMDKLSLFNRQLEEAISAVETTTESRKSAKSPLASIVSRSSSTMHSLLIDALFPAHSMERKIWDTRLKSRSDSKSSTRTGKRKRSERQGRARVREADSDARHDESGDASDRCADWTRRRAVMSLGLFRSHATTAHTAVSTSSTKQIAPGSSRDSQTS